MTNFKDIQFKQHPNRLGVQGQLIIKKFKKEFLLSVVAGQGLYSLPREKHLNPDDFSKFEVAILNENGFCTKDFVPDAGDDVLGWQTRDDINTLIETIINK